MGPGTIRPPPRRVADVSDGTDGAWPHPSGSYRHCKPVVVGRVTGSEHDPAEHLTEEADRFQSGGGDVGEKRHAHIVRGCRLRAPDDGLAAVPELPGAQALW